MGHANVTGRGPQARIHLAAVTGMTLPQAESHIHTAGQLWITRSSRGWTLDLSILTAAGITLARPHDAEARAEEAVRALSAAREHDGPPGVSLSSQPLGSRASRAARPDGDRACGLAVGPGTPWLQGIGWPAPKPGASWVAPLRFFTWKVLREQLGIAGMGVEAAKNFRDKHRMKALLREHDLPCARATLVHSATEAVEAALELLDRGEARVDEVVEQLPLESKLKRKPSSATERFYLLVETLLRTRRIRSVEVPVWTEAGLVEFLRADKIKVTVIRESRATDTAK